MYDNIRIYPDDGECDALLQLAKRELRELHGQAAAMIREELQGTGLLSAAQAGAEEERAVQVLTWAFLL